MNGFRIINEGPLLTAEQLLAMPEDVDRWLIRGGLRERPKFYRDALHACVLVQLCYALKEWAKRGPGGTVAAMAGVLLRRNPDTAIDVDCVYVSARMAAEKDRTQLFVGPPVLAAEILSPENTMVEIDDRIDEYLDAGVLIVWVIDPHDRTVTVYRPGARPETFNDAQELTAEPHLPGFRVAIAELFE